MRIIIDIMIGLMLVAAIAGGLYLYNSQAKGERDIEAVRVALQQLQQQATYHRTVQSAMADRDVLLVHIHEQWFGDDVPANALVTNDRPWIDLAPPGDLGQHPPDPVVQSSTQASFWYNPTTGVFRARVSPASTEAKTLALYNDVNGTDLPYFDQIPDTSRTPLAHVPDKTPVQHYATLANKTWSETKAKAPPAVDLLQDDNIVPAKTPNQWTNEANLENVNVLLQNQTQNVHEHTDADAIQEPLTSKRPTLKDAAADNISD